MNVARREKRHKSESSGSDHDSNGPSPKKRKVVTKPSSTIPRIVSAVKVASSSSVEPPVKKKMACSKGKSGKQSKSASSKTSNSFQSPDLAESIHATDSESEAPKSPQKGQKKANSSIGSIRSQSGGSMSDAGFARMGNVTTIQYLSFSLYFISNYKSQFHLCVICRYSSAATVPVLSSLFPTTAVWLFDEFSRESTNFPTRTSKLEI